jgi:hypothetical protein
LTDLQIVDSSKLNPVQPTTSIVAFDHWIQNENSELKANGRQAFEAIRDIAFAHDQEKGKKTPLHDAHSFMVAASVAAIRTVDRVEQGLTPRGVLQGIHDTAESVSNAVHYYAHTDASSMASDVSDLSKSAAKWLSDKRHASAVELGSLAGACTALGFFSLTHRKAVSESELASKLGITQKDAVSLTHQQLETLGFKRIEPIEGRLPDNWQMAGQVMRFEGKLGEKYPDGVRFDENGFPDFSPYVGTINGRRGAVDIDLTGSRKEDFRRCNQEFGLRTTPTGYRWHHHENAKTMQLVPRDLHEAVKHTGGCATSGLNYNQRK